MAVDMLVKINTEIKYRDGDTERISAEVIGNLYHKGKEHFLRYKENQELGNTTTIIKWSEDNPLKLTIIRQGDVKVTQVFQQECTDVAIYSSPNGTMELTTFAAKVETDILGLSKGTFTIQYQTKINTQIIGDYNTQISYELAE